MATMRYTMETQVFGDQETRVPVYQSTRSYTGDGVISENGKWRLARFAGGFFTPDPVIARPVNPGSGKAVTRPGMLPDTLTTAIKAPRWGAHYYITDHQGNNVAVVDSTGHVEQRTDYYPYGTPWANTASHPFLYSGKEWLAAHGLNEYDFDARRYAPLLPRFTTLDPLCEKRPWESPYLYCGANPVNAIDPNGQEWRMKSYRDEDEEDILHIDIEFTGVVYNASHKDYNVPTMRTIANKIERQIEEVFTYTNENVDVKMDATIKAVSSKNQVKSNDHVFAVVDSKKYFDHGQLAKAYVGSMLILLTPQLTDDVLSNRNTRSVPHEVGHTGGLLHPNDKTNTIQISNPGNNLMTQLKDCPKNTPINSLIQIEPAQIKAILKLYEEKDLNIKFPKQLLP
ncbi:MAG: hypothetical protein K2H14_08060 [Muribaculaceae bacterium]|nr:hypothetical protein [Muribaculaceae bacterium]